MLLEILLLVATLALVFYFNHVKNYNRWKKAGIPHPEPSFPFGTIKEVATQKKHFNVMMKEQYKQFNAKVYGLYLNNRPVLVVNDPDIAKQIMVKDFNNFVDRQPNRRPKFVGDTDKVEA